jgi:hypothetical protein
VVPGSFREAFGGGLFYEFLAVLLYKTFQRRAEFAVRAIWYQSTGLGKEEVYIYAEIV